MGSLDQDDMDLLGINSSPSKVDGVKDQTLIVYARNLADRGEMKSSSLSGQPQVTREGWEISIALLGRLDSTERSEEMVETFLENFTLDSSSTVDKLWTLLNSVGMGRHAEMVADVGRTHELWRDYANCHSHMPTLLRKVLIDMAKHYGTMRCLTRTKKSKMFLICSSHSL